MSWKVRDHYFKKAKRENYLARSVYKLEEIDKKFRIIRPSDRVLDLGYFPGSWIQYTHLKVGDFGLVVGVDIKAVNKKLLHHKGIKLFEKSIFEIKKLQDVGEDAPFDVIVSDMAPSTTGIRSLDQDRSLNLTESVFHTLPLFLKEDGNFVIKVFDSHQTQVFLKDQKKFFRDFKFFRPKSTRSVSKEFFAIGRGYRSHHECSTLAKD